MPAASASNSGTRPKPSTRSSLRHSLNFASMGKALVDVINKEGRDGEKAGKKTKESSSRRLSAINLQTSAHAPRASLGDTKPPMFVSKKEDTPESRTITRRRMSSNAQKVSADDSLKSPETANTPQAGVKRSSSLRPRVGGSTALPKYRPKSAILESGTKIPSPPRSIRKRPDSSDEERQKDSKPTSSHDEKDRRPISPLPHRAALKANLTNAIRLSPSTPPASSRPLTPKSSKSTKPSPSRPAKSAKTSSTACAIPRPPSASSTSSSFTPKTPTSVKHVAGSRRIAKELASQSDGSQRGSPRSTASESPLARHSRQNSTSNTPTKLRLAKDTANMSHITEVDSEDDCDADDVALLLAPVSNLAAPTPAMPRLQSRLRKRVEPETPTKCSPSPNNQLPTRANLSYLSPLPPDGDSPPSLRPPKQGSAKAARGSILSWDQFAEEASRTLEPGEIDAMLSDIPAPFAPGPVSPAPSTSFLLDVPESPCLSAINSPSAYGSISQVLLPDVTPSPAVHHYTSPRDLDGAADASLVTLLRLQLAAAENMAKERLYQMQTLEKELHDVKNARRTDTEDLTQQVSFLETNVRETLEARERSEAERQAYTTSLERLLQNSEDQQRAAIEDAVARAAEDMRKSHEAALLVENRKWIAACAARDTSTKWMSVRAEAESLLDTVRQDQEVLAIFKAELDLMEMEL